MKRERIGPVAEHLPSVALEREPLGGMVTEQGAESAEAAEAGEMLPV